MWFKKREKAKETMIFQSYSTETLRLWANPVLIVFRLYFLAFETSANNAVRKKIDLRFTGVNLIDEMAS